MKVLHNVNNLVLKGLCKFQVDIPKNSRVTAVQSLQNLHKFILPQPRWYVKECLPAIFPYNIIENSPTSLTYDSAFVGPNNFRSGTKMAYCMHGLVGHIKIWSKLIIICMIMFLMTSYADHR